MTDEQRRQTAQSTLARRVASILALACVTRLAEVAADIGAVLWGEGDPTPLPALANAKIDHNATPSYFLDAL